MFFYEGSFIEFQLSFKVSVSLLMLLGKEKALKHSPKAKEAKGEIRRGHI